MRVLKKHLDLEWETLGGPDDDRSAETGATESTDAAESGEVELPQESLDELRAALKIKNISALKRVAEALGSDPATAPAGEEIGRLVRAFNFEGLTELVERLAQPKQ